MRIWRSKSLLVIGGTGFIGRHFISSLASAGCGSLRVLSRSKDPDPLFADLSVEMIEGDLQDAEALERAVEACSVVVNLAYLSGASHEANMALIGNLLASCARHKVRRLIHVSTAVVAGRASPSVITESIPAQPFSDYEKSKFEVEQALLQSEFAGEIIILRPTAVFGPGGQNLLQLARDVTTSSPLSTYIKACLHGRRTMNLVPVADVVSALRFLVATLKPLRREVFLISADEAPENNYQDLESLLREHFGLPRRAMPPLVIPRVALRALLAALNKPNIDPQRRYACTKLEQLGWNERVSFVGAVEEFAAWYASAHP